MAEILPHSSVLRANAAEYLDDVAEMIATSCNTMKRSSAFQGIYKTVLATDVILSEVLSSGQPRMSVARSIVRRIPVLFAASQLDAAAVGLRQFIEVTFYAIYFSDHPIEWTSFQKHVDSAVINERTTPIASNAHREPSFYANYAKELFEGEPSGLARTAAGDLSVEYGNLSRIVHAGKSTLNPGLRPAISMPKNSELESFAGQVRSVCSASAICLCAFDQRSFNNLSAIGRSWFDWLIGSRARQVRSQAFGLAS